MDLFDGKLYIILNQPIASVLGAVFGIFLGALVNKAVSAISNLIKNM